MSEVTGGKESHQLQNMASTPDERHRTSSSLSATNIYSVPAIVPVGTSEGGKGKTVPRVLAERVEDILQDTPNPLVRSSPGWRLNLAEGSAPEALYPHKGVMRLAPDESLDSDLSSAAWLRWQPQSPSAHLDINPFKKLPLELLVLIFQLGSIDNPATFPTLVAQVSKCWREMAMSSRFLWTYINWSGANPEVKATCWLERSASIESPRDSSPIHISLAVEEGFEPDVAQMRYVMNFLKPEIWRWESFRIHVDREPLEVALELCDTAAPLLRHLSIGCSDSEGVEDQFVLFDDRTPCLQSLHLLKVPMVWTGPLLTKLTELHLADLEDGFGPSIEELISILEASPRLKKLVLDNAGVSIRSPPDFYPKVVQMPHLEQIQMTRLDRDVYTWFTRYMQAIRAHTYVSSEFEETAIAEVDILAHHPTPNLQRLVAIHARVDTPLLRNLLQYIMTSTVEFYYCSVEDGLLEALVWGPRNKICPNLTKLKLFRCSGFSAEVVKRIVISRQVNGTDSAVLPPGTRPPAYLRTVEVIGSSLPVSAAGLQWFRDHNVTWVDQISVDGNHDQCNNRTML
ncbi:hypothetical protein FRB95_012044 [Tulasnella sp. JGI-2019a]|nr:hypothetical protein FRB95_012044 [Tulasnella sp. JGI-2019a]